MDTKKWKSSEAWREDPGVDLDVDIICYMIYVAIYPEGVYRFFFYVEGGAFPGETPKKPFLPGKYFPSRPEERNYRYTIRELRHT